MPRIPLIEDLTTDPVPDGSNLLVEFDPAWQWYNASVSIMAGWIRTGGKVAYNVAAQPAERVRLRLKGLGLDPADLENDGTLRLFDWYTTTLGKKSSERFVQNSLKVADMSIQFAKEQVPGPPIPEFLGIMDNASVQARFNDEKAWIEFALTRAIPSSYTRKSTSIDGILRGAHSEWAYTQLEAAYDGIIDFKLEEDGRSTRDLIRIRSMRDVLYDREWHELRIGHNFEVTLTK
jgi:KaiC/GvpD/RAD55 family RecA-like ATPase